MGADIRTEGHHAVVRGVPRLSGAPVRAPDIRAGAALVLAGLVAEGETVVAGATTSTAATRTSPASCARSAPTWSAGEPGASPAAARRRPAARATDPAELFERAAAGDRGALARLLSWSSAAASRPAPSPGSPTASRRPTRSGSPGRRGPGSPRSATG